MSKVKVSDFYYGAVLSILLNRHIHPALVEGDEDRQVYDFTTDNGEFRLFIKYRTDKSDVKAEDYNSWVFRLTEKDIDEITGYIDQGRNLVVALMCAVAGLAESEVAALTRDEIKEIIDLGKQSMTISRKKGEHAYRISVGGGRDHAMQVKVNRFDELFKAN
ncbi:Hypothetical protein DEACI_3965 [Acididesulfobacillus acetoxydans]|uniref:Uncharacterized protein n=1 Tax=Acididesulfobacillus acetoxydans TaxID=1561005 RepID=A0A8S0WI72_9FIRM|nr:hypothetical protein [Acididesulfobacillus acetoxydans]CAA7603142.1 Hypothetical protein DEACI_3965 [Acididesulfobacillus acetoxydans]CEJ07630.1 Hypothetical protein DEACI_2096 [Acididesulfobacillus acetoxydans]